MSAAKKLAIVVGAGPGLGAATARALARKGYQVAVLSRNKDSLCQIRDEINSAGGEVRSHLPLQGTV